MTARKDSRMYPKQLFLEKLMVLDGKHDAHRYVDMHILKPHAKWLLTEST